MSLYEAVTLVLPFDGAGEEQILTAISTKDPLPARRREPAVPRDLETILSKCLERDPARRYQSAAEVRDDLQRFLENRPILARRPGLGRRALRLGGRHRVAIAAALIAGIVVTAGGWTWREHAERRADLSRLDAILAAGIETGRAPTEEAEWGRLQPLLTETLAREPESPTAQLARRAAAKVAVRGHRPHGLVSEPPVVQIDGEPAFDLGMPFVYVTEVDASWDGGPWHPVGWSSFRSGSEHMSWASIGVKDLAGDRGVSPSPHVAKFRARIHFVPAANGEALGIAPGMQAGGGPLARELPLVAAAGLGHEDRDLGSIPITLFDQYPEDFPPAIDDGGVAVPAGLAITRVLLDASPVTAAPGSRVRLPRVSGLSDHEVDVPLDWVAGRLGMAALHLEGALHEDDVPIAGHFVLRNADGAMITEFDMAWGRIAVLVARGRSASTRSFIVQGSGSPGFGPIAGPEVTLLVLSLDRLPLRAAPEPLPTRGILEMTPSRDMARWADFETYFGRAVSVPVEIGLVQPE